MTDERWLSDALHGAVPDPPLEPDRAATTRRRAREQRRRRRRRVAAVAAAVVVAALALPGVRSLHGPERPAPHEEIGRPVPGPGDPRSEGAPACRTLAGKKLGPYSDSRTIDTETATRWLQDTHSHVDPAFLLPDQPVTICLYFSDRASPIVLLQPGRRPIVDGRFGYPDLNSVMDRLDRLDHRGAATVDAPFACPSVLHQDPPTVSGDLPTGATAARICYAGTWVDPPQVLTEHVDALVRTINASPITYYSPNWTCGGIAGGYDYSVIFDYPSGTRTATVEVCRGLGLGAFTRNRGLPGLEERFVALLRRQVGEPSATPPPCPVTDSGPTGLGDLRYVVAARYCPGGSTGPGIALNGARLAEARTWGHELERGITGHCIHSPDSPTLALTDAWGDKFTVVVCDRAHFVNAMVPATSGPPQVVPVFTSRFVHVLRDLGAR